MNDVKRWKLGWKRCDCVKCEAALTIEQTEENCGWVMWEHHKEEVARLKAEVQRLTVNTDKLCKHGDLEIERLKAEVERLRKAGEWQPIKTAPKDGTAVLIYCQVSGAVEAHWDCEWLDRHNDACDIYEVTHWTQLTKPLAAKEGKPSV